MSNTQTAEAQTGEPRPDRWRILAVILAIGFMALLDVTIVNVAVPSIQEGLGTSPETVQWVVSGYALTFGLVLVAGGRLGDMYGQRILILVGLTAFIATSAAVGLSPNALFLVTARLLQGVSAGFLTPQVSGLIQQLFSGRERGIAFGYFGATVSVAAATGPVLGGVIIALLGEDHGWRYIFGINVPIGLAAIWFVWRRVPRLTRPHRSGAERHLDVVGALLLGAAVVCVLLPTIEAQGGIGPILLLMIACPFFAAAFVLWERRERRRGLAPLLDVQLLRQTQGYASGIAVGTVYFTGFTGIFLVMSVFLQQGVHLSALQTGLLLTPFALGSAVIAPIAGRLVSRFYRKVTVAALGVMLAGVFATLLVLPSRPESFTAWWLLAPLLVAGLGAGAVVSPNQTLALNDVPPEMGGAAGAALQSGQRVGAALGSAVIVTVYRIAADRSGNPAQAAQIALGSSLLILTCALAVAVWDARHR